METTTVLPCPWEPSTGSFPDSDDCRQHLQTPISSEFMLILFFRVLEHSWHPNSVKSVADVWQVVQIYQPFSDWLCLHRQGYDVTWNYVCLVYVCVKVLGCIVGHWQMTLIGVWRLLCLTLILISICSIKIWLHSTYFNMFGCLILSHTKPDLGRPFGNRCGTFSENKGPAQQCSESTHWSHGRQGVKSCKNL
jgi:hypothetical protein